MSSHQVN